MRGFGPREALLLLTVAVLACSTTAVASGGLSIEIDGDGNAAVDDPDGIVVAEDHDQPDRYGWELDLDGNYTLANVTIDPAFPVERARQLVPTLDGRHFVEVRDAEDVDRPAAVFNLSPQDGAEGYELGLPGPGEANLSLARDLQPPTVEIVSVANHTDVGFDVTTDTSEAALAELFVRTTDGERLQTYPTVRPGPWQKFPVQGLDANTTYLVQVEVWDWSANEAQTEEVEVTTEPEEDPIEPTVEPVRPAPNATVSPNAVIVEASYEEHGWPIVEEDVTMFFDKERVDPSRLEIGEGTITYRPEETLDAREYFVSVEVPNTAGGEGVARWSFHVEGDTGRSAPGPLGLVPMLAGALLLAARRRA